VPYDEGLPEVQLFRRRHPDGSVTSTPLSGHEVFNTNDQHAHVRLPVDSPLAVGDVVRLGISHPCTLFDKWSLLPVLDDATTADPVVLDLLRTHF
jgi:D-serine deaminase-like pyridoxal phosphate-dependent protein